MIQKVYSHHNSPEVISNLCARLRDGAVLVYPMDGVYALGCHALKERAVERICRLKQVDPKTHPLSVVCKDLSAVSEYAYMSTKAFKLLKNSLPGPFTFILPAKNALPRIFRGRKGSEVGIRIPESELLVQLLEMMDAPLMTASLPSPPDDDESYLVSPALIDECWGDYVDLVLDAGDGRVAQTTVVSLMDDEPEVIREGEGHIDM